MTDLSSEPDANRKSPMPTTHLTGPEWPVKTCKLSPGAGFDVGVGVGIRAGSLPV